MKKNVGRAAEPLTYGKQQWKMIGLDCIQDMPSTTTAQPLMMGWGCRH